jgi:hypothetical protein
MAFTNPIVGGNGNLVRNQIQSPDFDAGVSGWIIRRDGSVEFNDALIRGSLSAGAGTVLLNDGGLHIQGTNQQFDINHAGGFLARRSPDDGAEVQITVINTPTEYGGIVGLGVPTPTVVNGNDIDRGLLFAGVIVAGAVDTPFTDLRSPNVTAKDGSQITLFAVGSDDTESRIQLNTARVAIQNRITVDGTDLGRGKVTHDTLTATSAPIGAAETVVMSALQTGGFSFNYKAGRAYRVEFAGSYDSSVAATDVLMRIRKTNAAGQQISVARFTARAATTSYDGSWTTYFTIGAADVTSVVMVLTLTGTGASNARISAAATSPAFLNIYDCGLASEWPNAAVLV